MRLHKYLIPIIVFLLPISSTAQNSITYNNKGIEKSSKYAKGNNYQKDFLLFMDMLQQTHPAFAGQAPFDIESTLKRGYKRSARCKDNDSFVLLLQSVAAKIHDGHTTVNFTNAGLLYPMHFYADEKGFYLDVVQSGNEESLGKQINKINGKEMSEIYNRFRDIISYDNEATLRKTFKNIIPSFSSWQQLGLCSADSSITLTFTDGSSVNLRPIPKKQLIPRRIHTKPSKTQLMRSRSNRMPFSFELIEPGICYILFDRCESRSLPTFSAFLDSMFQTMQASSINTLVVDVRENSGGDSALCEELLRRLKNNITYYSFWTRPSQLVSDYYHMMGIDESTVNFKDTIQAQLQGVETPFTGNIIWIQGERTFSSAGLLITTAVDNNIGIVIGEQASYNPNHYGNIIGWTLPNTNVQGYISHRFFLRPNKTHGNDIPLKATLPTTFDDYINGIDPCLDWIISNYPKYDN